MLVRSDQDTKDESRFFSLFRLDARTEVKDNCLCRQGSKQQLPESFSQLLDRDDAQSQFFSSLMKVPSEILETDETKCAQLETTGGPCVILNILSYH